MDPQEKLSQRSSERWSKKDPKEVLLTVEEDELLHSPKLRFRDQQAAVTTKIIKDSFRVMWVNTQRRWVIKRHLQFKSNADQSKNYVSASLISMEQFEEFVSQVNLIFDIYGLLFLTILHFIALTALFMQSNLVSPCRRISTQRGRCNLPLASICVKLEEINISVKTTLNLLYLLTFNRGKKKSSSSGAKW